MQIIWDEFLKIIKEEAGSQVVETWFKAVCLETWDPERKEAILKAPNQFVSKWINDHYLGLLKAHLSRLFHTDDIHVRFIHKANNPTNHAEKTIIPASVSPLSPQHRPSTHRSTYPVQTQFHKPKTQTGSLVPHKKSPLVVQSHGTEQNNQGSGLNENYRFDTFIVGPNNSLAHAAAYAVSDSLGTVYNPLFIYGGTGLGKTHLLHSLGNEAKKKHPSKVVRYVSSDQFVNEFINAIRFDRSNKFREKYQNIDLLLLDDIQFLSNKEQTQEMFFHIFNVLHEKQKQIVLSSDTFPKEIKGLQSRLRSRIEWGLVADIQTPDLETKIAIIKKKASEQNIAVPDEVAHYIATKVISNIRELEGAMIRVTAFASLTNQPITMELATKVLMGLHAPQEKREGAELDNILRVVARSASISINDIKSKKRHKDIAATRQTTFYLMKKLTHYSLQTIGNFVGGRDHSTVIHAISKVETKLSTDSNFAQKLKTLEQKIQMH